MKVNKAVFTVMGMGIRILPAKNANPKEMLSIVGKTLIQLLRKKLSRRDQGMHFVTSNSKSTIDVHFDKKA